MRKRMSIHWLLLGVAVFLGFGINRLLAYEKVVHRARQHEILQKEIEDADRLQEARVAVEAYRKIAPTIPEVQLRILQKEWSMALQRLHQVQLAKYNRALEDEVPDLYRKLEEHLGSMKDRCEAVLTEDHALRKEVAWRVYNIEGAVRLLGAFTVLETEKNWKKANAAVAAAIAALKSAIESVDEASVSNLERDIPRWNLELLHANVYVKQLNLIEPDKDRLQLRDNLEAVIPEKGGYAPGEPLERRIRK